MMREKENRSVIVEKVERLRVGDKKRGDGRKINGEDGRLVMGRVFER